MSIPNVARNCYLIVTLVRYSEEHQKLLVELDEAVRELSALVTKRLRQGKVPSCGIRPSGYDLMGKCAMPKLNSEARSLTCSSIHK
jgi:hypothetical protein